MRRILTVAFLLLVVCSVALAADDAATIIRNCGQPDVDDSTLRDVPQPRIVTRWIEYRDYGVKFLFVADPSGWRAVSAVDMRANRAITIPDGMTRSRCR
jgi:hypothetical protein